MKFRRPRSLNGLILVGFGLVALPLLIAVIWALVNLDRLAEQSERLVFTGVAAAQNNRLLEEHLGSLERVARQYQVLGSPDSLLLLEEDLATIDTQLAEMAPLTGRANATALAASITRSRSCSITSRSRTATMPCEFRLLIWLPAMPTVTE